jgi:acyl carrier protein
VSRTASIEKNIISIIAEVAGVEEDEINSGTKLVEDLEVDSIKAIEIVVAIEKKYNIRIRDEDVPKITTVNQAVEVVNALLDQPAGDV